MTSQKDVIMVLEAALLHWCNVKHSFFPLYSRWSGKILSVMPQLSFWIGEITGAKVDIFMGWSSIPALFKLISTLFCSNMKTKAPSDKGHSSVVINWVIIYSWLFLPYVSVILSSSLPRYKNLEARSDRLHQSNH